MAHRPLSQNHRDSFPAPLKSTPHAPFCCHLLTISVFSPLLPGFLQQRSFFSTPLSPQLCWGNTYKLHWDLKHIRRWFARLQVLWNDEHNTVSSHIHPLTPWGVNPVLTGRPAFTLSPLIPAATPMTDFSKISKSDHLNTLRWLPWAQRQSLKPHVVQFHSLTRVSLSRLSHDSPPGLCHPHRVPQCPLWPPGSSFSCHRFEGSG